MNKIVKKIFKSSVLGIIMAVVFVASYAIASIQLTTNFQVNTNLPLDSRTVVADITARDAILAGQRYQGLIVYVVSTATNYQLQGGITNLDWTIIAGGGLAANISGGLGGQILYQSDVDITSKLLNGAAGQVLTSNGTILPPSWETVSGAAPPITVNNNSNLFSTGLTGTGDGVTIATFSNFFGENAGYQATSASFSNFFGENAGNGATSASRSNFFGENAGQSATGASYSNFLGSGAGSGATDASKSNFLGNGAGSGATDASNSNFFGYNAGYGATDAFQSNFLGYQAGKASSSSNSNFLGVNAGNLASADHSNFFGLSAGFNTTSTSYSNFFGVDAGNSATNASNSNFLGQSAGRNATSASNSIFIGQNAGEGDIVDNTTNGLSSILIGSFTNTDGFSNSILLGSGLSGFPIANTKENQFMLADTITDVRWGGIEYTLPSLQGAESEVLTNDGSGGLTWAVAGGGLAANISGGLGGQILYQSDVDITSKLANGTAGQVLTSAGTILAPTWTTITSGSGANALGTYITQTATNAPANAQILASLGTGILKSTTTTGVLSIATSGDFPTFNQDTTGTSANISGGLGGQILYQSDVDITSKLLNGAAGQILTSAGTILAPTWTTPVTSPITVVNTSNLFSTGIGAGSGVTGTTYSNFFGENAGNGATSASHSNFFGVNAGESADNASHSNFLGTSAGSGATFADNSNFLGDGAGESATDANSSNFLGAAAGSGATFANNSNFLGSMAGDAATGASYSNFLGAKAGDAATGASYSNFLGAKAGYYAATASNSIFIGQNAGINDIVDNTTNGLSSILIGSFTNTDGFSNSILLGSGLSGFPISNTKANQFMLAPTVTEMRLRGIDYTLPSLQGAVSTVLTNDGSGGLSWVTASAISSPITVVNSSNLFSTGLAGTGAGVTTTYSNFFGENAGNGATFAENSNFLGYQAGYGATDASFSNFLGLSAGDGAHHASFSNFLGSSAGNGATFAENSNFFGAYAGNVATGASDSNFFGQHAGDGDISVFRSNFLGPYAGSDAIFASDSNFIGNSAGSSATSASNSNFLGAIAGQGATSASDSNFLGYAAGSQATNASYSNLFGFQVGMHYAGNNIGSNNIIIGTNISLPDATANAMNLGGVLFATGTYSDSGAATPSITAVSGGKVGIGAVSPSTILEIGSSDLGDGAAGPIITLGRNTNITNTGAGSINFLGKAGTAGYVWQDAAGKMRIYTSAPTNAGDALGTVIGDQTSTRETKTEITPYTDYSEALAMVTNAPLNTFRYIKEISGYGIDSPLAKTRIGFIADEVDPMFMVGNSIDQVSVNGLLMASIKELDLKVKALDSVINGVTLPTMMGDFFGGVVTNVADGVAYMTSIIVDTLKVGSSEKPTGITLYDTIRKTPYCISVTDGETITTEGECGTTSSGGSNDTPPEKTPTEKLQDVNAKITALIETNYTPESWTIFTTTLTTVLKLSETNDEEKIAKTNAFNDAIAELVSIENTTLADLTAYNEALAKVTSADYTAESWTTYQAVVTANVVADADTQTKVDEATLAITTAQQDILVEIPTCELPKTLSEDGVCSNPLP